jgi:hypothetical protein
MYDAGAGLAGISDGLLLLDLVIGLVATVDGVAEGDDRVDHEP